MFYLIYSSYATNLLSDGDLNELLMQSRQRNIFTKITGVLFYFEGKFIQLLEGSEVDVKVLYAKLYNDSRHQTLQLHKESEIEKRSFTDWTMAFKPIANSDAMAVSGFNDMSLPNAASVASVMKLYQLIGDK